MCIQIVPAIVLAAGMLLFMPQSPRHLMNVGREEECLETLARLRNKNKDDIGVRIEFLEIKAIKEFETRTVTEKYPHLQDGSAKSRFLMGVNEYKSLITNRSLLKRSIVACLTMTFQQCKTVQIIGFLVVLAY